MTQYPFYRRLGEPQGQSGQVQKISPLLGLDPRIVQPVVRSYTHYAILAHHQTLTTKTNHLLYRKAVAFYYENHVKHINTLSGRRVGVQGL